MHSFETHHIDLKEGIKSIDFSLELCFCDVGDTNTQWQNKVIFSFFSSLVRTIIIKNIIYYDNYCIIFYSFILPLNFTQRNS